MDQSKSNRTFSGIIGAILSGLIRFGRFLVSLRIGPQVGLVISEHSIRVCLIKRFLNRNRVADVATFALDPSQTETWAEVIEAAGGILIGYLKDHNLKNVPINIGLSREDIAFRRMYLPQMSGKELYAAMRWEGEKLFPFEFDQCCVDYRVVGKHEASEISRICVNIVAAKSIVIETIYDRLHAAGLRIGQVGFLPNFIAELPLENPKPEDRHNVILHISDDQSMAIFVHDGVLEFFQQFVTRPLGRPDNENSLSNLDALSAELISFIDLYNGQSPGNIASAIHICGKYANDDTASFFGHSTGLPCYSLNGNETLSKKIGEPDQNQTAEYLDAIMIALAHPYRLLLVPTAIRRHIERKNAILRIGTVSVIALLVAASMHIQLHHLDSRKKVDLKTLRASVHSFEGSPGYQGYVNLIGKLKREQAYLKQTSSRQNSYFHVLLKELSLLAPDHINLTDISLSKEDGQFVLHVDGHVRLTGFSPEIILAQYVESLGNSLFFENVSVSNHNKKQEYGRFDLTFRLEMDTQV